MNKYIIIRLILELVNKFIDHHEEISKPKPETQPNQEKQVK